MLLWAGCAAPDRESPRKVAFGRVHSAVLLNVTPSGESDASPAVIRDPAGVLHVGFLRCRVINERDGAIVSPIGVMWSRWGNVDSRMSLLGGGVMLRGRSEPVFVREGSGRLWLLSWDRSGYSAWDCGGGNEQSLFQLVQRDGSTVHLSHIRVLPLRSGKVLLIGQSPDKADGLIVYTADGIDELTRDPTSPRRTIPDSRWVIGMIEESDGSLGILQTAPLSSSVRKDVLWWCSASLDENLTQQRVRLDVQYPVREMLLVPGRSWKEQVPHGLDEPVLIGSQGRTFVVWVGTVAGRDRGEVVCGREPGSPLGEERVLSDSASERVPALPSAAELPDGTIVVSWLLHRSGHAWDLVHRAWSPDTGRLGSIAVAGTWDLGPWLGARRGSLTIDGLAHTTVCGTRDGKTGVWLVPLFSTE